VPGRLPALTSADVERVLSAIGFVLDRQRGSHRVWVREADGATIVVPERRGDLRRGTPRAIIRDTGLTVEEFLEHR
jgi:predicted RNA binding protein YcfA (HicA-like mRNA interferase family)